MADEIDAAYETEQRHLAAALKARHDVLEATGFCANCNESISPQRVFCGKDCSDDWHWIQKLKKLSGR